jgi:hypothetical protein
MRRGPVYYAPSPGILILGPSRDPLASVNAGVDLVSAAQSCPPKVSGAGLHAGTKAGELRFTGHSHAPRSGRMRRITRHSHLEATSRRLQRLRAGPGYSQGAAHRLLLWSSSCIRCRVALAASEPTAQRALARRNRQRMLQLDRQSVMKQHILPQQGRRELNEC